MILAVDTETTGTDFFHGCKPFMVTACDGETNYIFEGDVNPYTRDVFWDEDTLDEITILLNKAHKIILHNACFDMRALESIGIVIDKYWDKLEDTLVASHCICSSDVHGLKDLAVKYLHYWDDDEEELATAVKAAVDKARREGYNVAREGHAHFPGLPKVSSWFKMDYWLCMDECRNYGARDAERTWLLWKTFNAGLCSEGLWFVYVERRKLLKIIYDMTSVGMHFDVQTAQAYVDSQLIEMERLRWEIKNCAGIQYKFDPNKRDHLIDLIHTRLKVPVLFYTKAENSQTPSVDKDALNYYESNYEAEAIVYLAKWRHIQTKVNYMKSYIKWVCDDGRIHSSFNLTGTHLTRQSSSSPNVQNVDKALAHYFGPPPGKVWLDLDLVNIELRIWTYIVNNKDLINIFERGESVHLLIAELIYVELFRMLGSERFKERIVSPNDEYTKTKGGTFAYIYGASEEKANKTYGVPNAIYLIGKKFPEIPQYLSMVTKELWSVLDREQVPAIYTLGGYRLDVPLDEIFKACNFKIQGTAGQIIGRGMVNVANNPDYQDSDSKMVNQVHDSLKIEIPIHPRMKRTFESICKSVEDAGKTLIPTCGVSYKVIVNEADQSNPYVQEWS